jgi:hypothetical protein
VGVDGVLVDWRWVEDVEVVWEVVWSFYWCGLAGYSNLKHVPDAFPDAGNFFLELEKKKIFSSASEPTVPLAGNAPMG